MPFYEYQCLECGHVFEEFQKITDPPIEKCPKCGGKVKKLISSSGLVFKGDGFYITDYARKGGGSTPATTSNNNSYSKSSSSNSSSSSNKDSKGKE